MSVTQTRRDPSARTRPDVTHELVSAIKGGASALVLGPAGTTGVLADAAAALGGRIRVLRVRPPYNLTSFMQQLAPNASEEDGSLLEDAYNALAVLSPGCTRIALLAEEAHLLPKTTLRYIESALRNRPHLSVALAGQPELADNISQDGLNDLRQRVTLHLELAASPGGAARRPDADPGPQPVRSRRRGWLVGGVLVLICAALIASQAPGLPSLGTLVPGSVLAALPPWLRGPAADPAAQPVVAQPAAPQPVAGQGAAARSMPAAAEAVPPPAVEASATPASATPASVVPPASAPPTSALERPTPAPPAPAPPEAAALPEPSAAPPAPQVAALAVPPPAPASTAPPSAASSVAGPQAAAPASVPAAAPPAAAAAVAEPAMVALTGGEFRMGSADDPSERPAHSVVVAPFLLARKAVTVQEWQRCVEAQGCLPIVKGKPQDPALNVSWYDARGYAAWLSRTTSQPYRLPTEAEWEYAARAGAATRYAWGNAMIPGRMTCKGCGSEPVSLQAPPAAEDYPPNAFGLLGLGGGAAEWVADCWHRTYQGAPRDGSTPWEAAACRERVLRGGSWMEGPSAQRPSSRDFYDPSVRYPTHGFRVARSN